MFDLKSKLLEAGLVTEKQAAAAKKKPQKQYKKPKGKFKKPPRSSGVANFEEHSRGKMVSGLKSQSKNEQYDTIRKWVDRNRLDKQQKILEEGSEKFFFQKMDGNVTWLTLSAELHSKLNDGQAGIMAYMSNHGLTHCVIPKDIAEDAAQVFPYWLRVLKGHDGAGQVEKPEEDDATEPSKDGDEENSV